MTEAFLLDIDGTLLSTTAGYQALQSVLVQRIGPELALSSLDLAGQTDRWIVRAALQTRQEHVDENDIDAVLAAYADALPQAIAEHGIHEIRGARRAIEWLRAHDVFVQCTTGNTSFAAAAKLAAIGLHELAPGAVCGDCHVTRQELLAAAMTDATRNYVVVGDTTRDIVAAREAGAFAIGVLSGGTPVRALSEAGAHVILESIDTLVAWYASLRQPPAWAR